MCVLFQVSDGGMYECVATNEAGNDTKAIALTVQGMREGFKYLFTHKLNKNTPEIYLRVLHDVFHGEI